MYLHSTHTYIHIYRDNHICTPFNTDIINSLQTEPLHLVGC